MGYVGFRLPEKMIVVKIQNNKRRRAADSIDNTARHTNALVF